MVTGCLAAVDPDGLCVGNGDGEGCLGGARGGGRDEAGEETASRKGVAGVREGGLDYAVVLGIVSLAMKGRGRRGSIPLGRTRTQPRRRQQR